MDIHAVQVNRLQTYVNRCGKNNGKCSHLCLPNASNQGFSCACPTGLVLQPDGKSCNTRNLFTFSTCYSDYDQEIDIATSISNKIHVFRKRKKYMITKFLITIIKYRISKLLINYF